MTDPSLPVSQVGDETLSVLEIWGAEYQENDALLIKPEQRDALQAICDRERCLMQVGRGSLLLLHSVLGARCRMGVKRWSVCSLK